MAYKRPTRTSVYVRAYPVVRERIKIPQAAVRPVQISSADLMKKELIRDDPWWYTLHRRGVRRPKVGEDPLEARAVSKSSVRGTLPERIVYKYLTNNLKMVAGADFDFQSSQSGGRLELGGLVADFLFPYMRIVIQVQGPTHTEYLRGKKDEEQRAILQDMGYRVFDIYELDIYNESRLDDWMRKTFALTFATTSGDLWVKSPGASAAASGFTTPEDNAANYEEEYEDPDGLQALKNEIQELSQVLK